MEIILFGIGKRYNRYKNEISQDDNVVLLLDNDKEKQGILVDGYRVFSPEVFSEGIEYDLIVVMSLYSHAIAEQLQSFGVNMDKVWPVERYIAYQKRGYLTKVFDNPLIHSDGKRVLLIGRRMDYDGSTMVLVYLAKALLSKGYHVEIATYEVNNVLLADLIHSGLIINIYPNLCYIDSSELFWIDGFQTIIVNTYPMMKCVSAISWSHRVIWWIHEAREVYDSYSALFNDVKEFNWVNVKVLAVSQIAKENFIRNQDVNPDIMRIGIADDTKHERKHNEKIIIAQIGGFSESKGQSVLLQALSMVSEEYKNHIQCWYIGKENRDWINKNKDTWESSKLDIRFLGKADRSQLREYYNSIDLVVVPSREETMSMVAIEAMMFEIPCIVTERTGIAEYITDFKNGMVVPVGDCEAIAARIEWLLSHRKEMRIIGMEARKTYEEYFTIEDLGERWTSIIEEKCV